MIAVIKKAIRIEKYNHNHDERGRFCSGGGVKNYPPEKCKKYEEKVCARALDAVGTDEYKGKTEAQIRNMMIEADNREFEKIRSDVYSNVERYAKAEERLGIDMKEAKKIIDAEFEEYMAEFKHRPKETMRVFLEVEVDDIIRKSVLKYAEKSGICSIMLSDEMDIGATLDYIDGVTWAKENIGFDCDIWSLGCFDSDDSTIAITHTSEHLEASMRVNTKYYGKDRKIDSTKNNGFNIKNQSAQSVGVHEAAHVIEGDIASKAKADTDDAYSVFDLRAVSKEIMARANEKVGGDAMSNTESVSKYALTSSSEAFAECLADCYSNGDSAQELSKAVLKVVKEEREDIIKIIGDKTSWWEG